MYNKYLKCCGIYTHLNILIEKVYYMNNKIIFVSYLYIFMFNMYIVSMNPIIKIYYFFSELYLLLFFIIIKSKYCYKYFDTLQVYIQNI